MKKLNILTGVLLASTLAASPAVFADNHGNHGNGHNGKHYQYKDHKNDKDYKNDEDREVKYSRYEKDRQENDDRDERDGKKYGRYETNRSQYLTKSQYEQLPPGLQKKVNRGKGLPPGWASKLNSSYYTTVPYNGGYRYVLDRDVYRDAKIVSYPRTGVVRINVDNRVLDVVQATRVILNVL